MQEPKLIPFQHFGGDTAPGVETLTPKAAEVMAKFNAALNGGDPEGVVLGAVAYSVKQFLDTLNLTWENKAGIAMVASILVMNEVPGINGRRGKVIKAMTEEFRKKLQAHLAL